ncbi:MAG: sulfite exporter TauE/SafE family protein [Rhodospirillaceae bacterium]|jgi:uncharacterized protein|nr:sulfite exporter TauE/SafE family protein [Rhodospirillaceae bacterium]MBT5373925.1 sulfite exporter TauE/SafE family protein [Rhodospirillaceae bacterium]MBT5660197.1 sulfite exporter TauE/SafE family protein [Rhodospirillaceae bacterium]MBT5751456.1 sulfite exporter TauE/SafE family protein [Rhodospirillaceae bacterium]
METIMSNWEEITLLAVAMLATGLLSGTLAGLLGIGGGIVVVPALYEVFTLLEVPSDIRMHVAIGTSLAAIIPTSIASTKAHFRRGEVDLDLIKSWAPALLVGAVGGIAFTALVHGLILSAIFAAMTFLIGLQMARGGKKKALFTSPPKGVAGQIPPFGVGALSTMMGLGGGTLGVPLLRAFNFPTSKAVGTAAAFGLIICIPGTIGMVVSGWDVANLPLGNFGYVNFIGFALIVPTAIFTAPTGASLGDRLGPEGVRRAFACFLFIVSARMIYTVLFD